MGSSGGGYSFSPKKTSELLDEAQKKVRETGFFSGLEDLLKDYLGDFNKRDIEQTNQHLATIEQALQKEIEGVLKLDFGGSVKKYTYIDGLSDVDMLVQIDQTALKNKSPKEVLDYFANRLKERLPNSEIKAGNLAVTVKFMTSGMEIQLLPALKTKTGYKIADPDSGSWSKVVKPEKFAKTLTEINQQKNSRVVPVIKLVKSINHKLPSSIKMTGYQIEALAVEIFKNYDGPKTHSKMVTEFFNQASKSVLKPVREITGQSEFVDEKFGPENSIQRRRLSKALQRVSNRITLANSRGSLDEWKSLFE